MTRASADRENDRLSSPTTEVTCADSAPAAPANAPAMAYMAHRRRYTGVPKAAIRARFSWMPRTARPKGESTRRRAT
ncbi:hypothetical protein D9M68_939620 [compost metagenome]